MSTFPLYYVPRKTIVGVLSGFSKAPIGEIKDDDGLWKSVFLNHTYTQQGRPRPSNSEGQGHAQDIFGENGGIMVNHRLATAWIADEWFEQLYRDRRGIVRWKLTARGSEEVGQPN